MAEYVEREAALQIIDYAKQLTNEQIVRESGTYELLSDAGKACYDGIITALAMCKRLINEAVIAADVQPVKHGLWITAHAVDVAKEFKCTACGGLIELPVFAKRCYYDYCPNCGAKMGGEKE